jgi:hypothetical protein
MKALSAAERQRRRRERIRAGKRRIVLEVDAAQAEDLILLAGSLGRADLDDARKVDDAFAELVRRWIQAALA